MSRRPLALELVRSPSPSESSEPREPELVPSTPTRSRANGDGGGRMLYIEDRSASSPSPVSHDNRAFGLMASPETPARPRAPPPPQAADEPDAAAGVIGEAGALFLDWAAASPLDDTQALDASSSGEGGREIDLTVAGDVSDEGSAVMAEYRLDDPLSQSSTESPEKDPCRRGCCALLPGRACEAHLVLLSSCRPTMDVPHVVHLGRERCFIGRAVESDVYLDSVLYPRTLSREHAVIERRGPCDFVLKDLRSVNGVYVNGKAVREEQELAPGDVVLFGRKTARPEFGYVFEVEDFREYRRLHVDREGPGRASKRAREGGGPERQRKLLRLDGMPPDPQQSDYG
ncbi:hypothetical protein FOZ63_027686 [Perkinsus olseni]|uniref:FHA domain-containing protein n=1 Tax=Perkinsus olseni TaxID=32597 RepID=A0A7J6Q242_PEROL|nr:hypothetical protein FOZ63_027686 [Perkinsus olseni]